MRWSHLSPTDFSTWIAFGFDWLVGFEAAGTIVDRVTPGSGDETSRSGVSLVADPPGWSWTGVPKVTTWFGSTSGSTDSVMGVDTPSGQLFAAPASGTIRSARAMVGSDTATCSVRALIYANSGGVPGALLGPSDIVVLTHPMAMALTTFPFSTPVVVASGTSYFLMIYGGSGSSWKHRRDPGPGTTYYRTPVAFPNAPNPFGAASSFGGYRLYLEAGIESAVPVVPFVPQVVIS